MTSRHALWDVVSRFVGDFSQLYIIIFVSNKWLEENAVVPPKYSECCIFHLFHNRFNYYIFSCTYVSRRSVYTMVTL